jgi:hypothetical protein
MKARETISVDEDIEEDFVEEAEKELEFVDDEALAVEAAKAVAIQNRSAWRKIEQLREMRELNKILQDEIYDLDTDQDF